MYKRQFYIFGGVEKFNSSPDMLDTIERLDIGAPNTTLTTATLNVTLPEALGGEDGAPYTTRAGLSMPADAAPRLHDRYVGHLRRILAARPGRAKLLPGLPQALAQTAPIAVNALLTGNWRAGAEAKLGAVGLWEQFRFGAFADDAADRNALVPIARRRAQDHGVTPGRVIVIGDTPHDVACARAGGAVAVAVCTGWSSREELQACGPDLLIEDLTSGLDAFLGLL